MKKNSKESITEPPGIIIRKGTEKLQSLVTKGIIHGIISYNLRKKAWNLLNMLATELIDEKELNSRITTLSNLEQVIDRSKPLNSHVPAYLFAELVSTWFFDVIDVRTADEHKLWPVIDWATLLPCEHDFPDKPWGKVILTTFENSFVPQIRHLDKNKPYLIYCLLSIRTKRAVQIMKDLGFKFALWLDWWLWDNERGPIAQLPNVRLNNLRTADITEN